VIARRPRGLLVAFGHQEDARARIGRGGQLLFDAVDRGHGAVECDHAGAGDRPPAGQVA
jgi:hypothetical protein